MPRTLDTTIDILEALVGFESVSGRPTHGIVGYGITWNSMASHPVLALTRQKNVRISLQLLGQRLMVESSSMGTQMSSL